MPLAWNEIRHRAIKFANENSKAASEAGEKQTFWNEFFEVFGIARKTVASFEAPVKKLTGHDGAIDLFWPGNLIVEHKSLGGHLGKAQSQAFEYIHALVNEGRHKEVPRYVVVSDFARVVLYDLEPDEQRDLPLFAGRRVQVAAEFTLTEFYKNIRPFAFIAGYKQQKLDPEDPANIEAAQIMANLHDALKAGGYTGHELRQFLVRILFCLFAEDTGIFPQPRQLELYLKNHTAEDGSDLGLKLARLFDVLNTPEDKRQTNLDADLKEFPYVNGDLFKERLSFADFNSDMRNALLAASASFRWEKISPAVFGSLFQDVMLPKERRQLGAHYTAEKNIMKVVRSLFLDDLCAEFEHIKKLKIGKDGKLEEFQKKLAGLSFFDPACGCGNFLVITYRELRALELEVLRTRYAKEIEQHRAFQSEFSFDVNKLSLLDVDQMFGIEIEEFPARIAEVALWLADHQANTELSIAFTQRYIRIPLRKSPHIHVENALRKDWKQILPPEKCSYILGNPPFAGKKEQNQSQKADMALIWKEEDGTGVLDYVTCWYVKASEYIQNTAIRVAFVSTNSISQGEQVGVLWRGLRRRFTLHIHFGHRSFAWESEARGKAHVHVVIIGFAAFDRPDKVIFEYAHSKAEPLRIPTNRINPYLADAVDALLFKRGKPLCEVPEISYGSMANDQKRGDESEGNLILTSDARQRLLAEAPDLEPYIRRFVGSREFINGVDRWCLWLIEAPPHLLRSSPELRRRIEAVREWRMSSGRAETVRLAATPSLFGEIRQPETEYLLLPKVSSEDRPYMPLGFMPPTVIANGSSLIIPGATRYDFGVLSSGMHMAWMRYTGGRMKSDYQYSSQIVYNNFPWPQSPADAQKAAVEEAAQAVLDARARFPGSTLADLYDPVAMPPALAKAHAELDRAVDRCYRKEPFPSDRARVEFLFKLYEELTAPLIAAARPKRSRRAPAA
ncbi:MAG: hypothetical protein L0Y58_17475 [Verrucomicrobia subdivision 3 bacterium]|nr:hypothetical protein [Limisphaerales bacterium]